MEKIYSNKIWMSMIHFIEKHFGKDVANRVLSESNIDRLALEDANGFQTMDFAMKITENAIRITGKEDLSYLAGRALSESLGVVGGTVIGLTSPALAMKLMGQIEGKMATKTINETEQISKNQYRVRISGKDGFKESVYGCQNRIGSYESMPRFFSLPYAKVDHPRCAFKGDPQCEYLVTVPEYGFIVFKKVALGFFLAAFVLAVLSLLGIGGPSLPYLGVSSLVSCLLAFSYYKHRQARHALDWTLVSNESLAKQNSELEKNNSQITSLQNLTLALGQTSHVQETCDMMVTTLVRAFGYGSSQIWLLDEDGKYLANKAANGYPAELDSFIRATRFEMGQNWDNPYGLLTQTLEQGKTLLVNDVEEAMAKLSPRTREFIKALNASSFIMTPLFHEKEPIGLLTAEHHGGKKLNNNDRLLFQSISNIVAGSLVKAGLFEGMELKVKQRTEQLETASRQLLAAQEIAIQSEKLSSLGQMAAGVAHEINNPLNFLVNIIPDVRRDVEGLEKIRELAAKAGLNGDLAKRIKEVDDEYDLETHLSEKNFVFEKIQKALDKSTRIANSLKVFSRSSSKEAIAKETFADMIREVIELVPRKVVGDTRIQVDIPPDLEWNVNKNEMEQAFLAIINNAIDAMEQKGTLEIRAVSTPSDITLSFRDEGPGIPEEAIKRIFDPFFTTKPPGKGTGLGLTIAMEIVKKYGGALAVQSVPGKGTTFNIRFRKT
ncbi:MAG: Sensory histidine kinase [Fibrobacteres bacterium]|nr:Sensory histidine kinase [Fibrobacterota bacterium]